jgi:3-dehydrosphinganine reductase
MVGKLDAVRTPENRAHTLTIPKLAVGHIAAETIAGIQIDRKITIPGRRTRAAVLANRLAPRLAD